MYFPQYFMSQVLKKNHCVEQKTHIFKHLCSPKNGIIFVPGQGSQKETRGISSLPDPSLYSMITVGYL